MSDININEDLTVESANDFLLKWAKDVSKETAKKLANNRSFFLGHPKLKQECLIGIYQKKEQLNIDWSLKPENAKDRGYIWFKDSIYDPEAPEGIMDDFFEMEKEGYLFGEPADVNIIQNGGVGVYKPLKLFSKIIR